MTESPEETSGFITIMDGEGALVLSLAGEIDAAVVISFEASAGSSDQGGPDPLNALVSVVEAWGVDFIDSMG